MTMGSAFVLQLYSKSSNYICFYSSVPARGFVFYFVYFVTFCILLWKAEFLVCNNSQPLCNLTFNVLKSPSIKIMELIDS